MSNFLKENVLFPLRNKTMPFYKRTFVAQSSIKEISYFIMNRNDCNLCRKVSYARNRLL